MEAASDNNSGGGGGRATFYKARRCKDVQLITALSRTMFDTERGEGERGGRGTKDEEDSEAGEC